MVNHPASLILNISIVLLKLYHLRKVKAILEVVDGSQMHQRKHLLVLYNYVCIFRTVKFKVVVISSRDEKTLK